MQLGKYALILPALLGLSGIQAHAAGLTITPIFDSSITTDPDAITIENTINSAISVYEADFTNPITVTINFKADQTVGLGQSLTYFDTVGYSDYRANLFATKALGADSTAFENFIPGGADNPVNNSGKVEATLANLRALGFAGENPSPGQADSTVSLKTSIMNLSSAGPQDLNKYSLFATASHEINEVLGLGSTLDGLSNSDPSPTGAIGTLDLFRYSSQGVRSFTTASNANSYFSVDGGQTNIVGFNQNQDGDFHDWASSGTPRVQDAFATPGSSPKLATAELTALEDVGYNHSSPVPEASSSIGFGLMLALGLGGFVFARKRKAGNASE